MKSIKLPCIIQELKNIPANFSNRALIYMGLMGNYGDHTMIFLHDLISIE